jgi:hypothetical protein
MPRNEDRVFRVGGWGYARSGLPFQTASTARAAVRKVPIDVLEYVGQATAVIVPEAIDKVVVCVMRWFARLYVWTYAPISGS